MSMIAFTSNLNNKLDYSTCIYSTSIYSVHTRAHINLELGLISVNTCAEGCILGWPLGCNEGCLDGWLDGCKVGLEMGCREG